MNLHLLSVCILSGLLMAAVVSDLRTRRIPNALVVYGATLGLTLQALAPTGTGLFPGTEPGLLTGLLGGLSGLALFLPLYVLRLMGAGDVKLVAMAGVWLGAQGVAYAVLWSLVAGGVLGLVAAVVSGALRQVGHNLLHIGRSVVTRTVSNGLLVHTPARTTGRLPYAVAIATGTAVEMVRLLSV